ncbi:MAG TPA: hypothetical protein PK522_00825 [Nitrosomonas sp.]|nr:hypothetical protein [Nitrosomonas sp.]
MKCPKCGGEWRCGCNSCKKRNIDGKVLAVFDEDEYASCGYCGLRMHHE